MITRTNNTKIQTHEIEERREIAAYQSFLHGEQCVNYKIVIFRKDRQERMERILSEYRREEQEERVMYWRTDKGLGYLAYLY